MMIITISSLVWGFLGAYPACCPCSPPINPPKLFGVSFDTCYYVGAATLWYICKWKIYFSSRFRYSEMMTPLELTPDNMSLRTSALFDRNLPAKNIFYLDGLGFSGWVFSIYFLTYSIVRATETVSSIFAMVSWGTLNSMVTVSGWRLTGTLWLFISSAWDKSRSSFIF